jgi:cysteine protease ATG4
MHTLFNIMMKFNVEQDGEYVDLVGDAADSIQLALFDLANESSIKKEDFISNYELKKKYLSKMGTNIRYYFNSKLKPLSQDSLVPFGVLQGVKYSAKDYKRYILDFSNIIWVSYRENFRSITEEKLINSDVGWGCTIRVGQMLLLATIKAHTDLSDWELIWKIQENLLNSPYSLHKIITLSKSYNKKPGDWFSPSSIGYILTLLLEDHKIPNLKSMITMNCTIYKNLLYSLAYNIPESQCKNICKCIRDEYFDLGETCSSCKGIIIEKEWENSVFVQVPMMLGMGFMLPEFVETIKLFLSMDQTVGIIGGKPRMALFIVGYTEKHLVVLDPHLVQPTARSEQEFKKLMATYHCKTPMVVPFEEIEGSLNLGFYFQDHKSWEDFEQTVNSDKRVRGVLSIADTEPDQDQDLIEIESDSAD